MTNSNNNNENHLNLEMNVNPQITQSDMNYSNTNNVSDHQNLNGHNPGGLAINQTQTDGHHQNSNLPTNNDSTQNNPNNNHQNTQNHQNATEPININKNPAKSSNPTFDLLNSETPVDITDILTHIMSVSETTDLEESNLPKRQLHNHPMRPALFQVLCDIKNNDINAGTNTINNNNLLLGMHNMHNPMATPNNLNNPNNISPAIPNSQTDTLSSPNLPAGSLNSNTNPSQTPNHDPLATPQSQTSSNPFPTFNSATPLEDQNFNLACRSDNPIDNTDPQQQRLDRMLESEGVTGDVDLTTIKPTTASSQPPDGAEHQEYRQKLESIREVYHQEVKKYTDACTGEVV